MELIRAAARAFGAAEFALDRSPPYDGVGFGKYADDLPIVYHKYAPKGYWNPLEDNETAFLLGVQLQIDISHEMQGHIVARFRGKHSDHPVPITVQRVIAINEGMRSAAIRRIICQCAAEIESLRKMNLLAGVM